ncbi:hypothetical protein O6H91_14G066500 [Diphasiastrum complanatum]|uniref:Uncharacterized protein n=1 Tax=Diphasiastrum complanatum TaxID=34168 RepID=A0ACC2BQD1_DIPCM|nr:hypothetical protein O6H91_14G066500 [Diphasiastrum complanatum]
MPPFSSEQRSKESHDYIFEKSPILWFDGAIIVGAGPSGLATAACLKEQGVPSIILEKADCIASLWQHRTYDRLHLHLPKHFCELPLLPFPRSFPTYPNRRQFIQYLQDYADHFHIHPVYSENVLSASYDTQCKIWRVQEYVARWIIVASGENADVSIPNLPGIQAYRGSVIHSSKYKNGSEYARKKVLVVGSGNSGMEIALDLANHQAKPSLVVRSPVHVLPREMFGVPTFAIIMTLLKTLPLWLADRLLVLSAFLTYGDTAKYGIKRPSTGPLEIKQTTGRTPVLDVGTVSKIKSGQIRVMPAMECLISSGATFIDGHSEEYDAIILATGYRSNVPSWLKGEERNFSAEGISTCGWKGGRGLYVVGLSRRGIFGAGLDAKHIAEDIREAYLSEQQAYLKRFRVSSR